MKRKERAWFALAALFLLLAAAAFCLSALDRLPGGPLAGLLTGGGVGLGVFFLSKALSECYYAKNERARKEMEVNERDERTRSMRGIAAYRALLAGTPIYLAVWLALLFLDVPLGAMLTVCAGYVAHFGVYLYHLVKLQKEM